MRFRHDLRRQLRDVPTLAERRLQPERHGAERTHPGSADVDGSACVARPAGSPGRSPAARNTRRTRASPAHPASSGGVGDAWRRSALPDPRQGQRASHPSPPASQRPFRPRPLPRRLPESARRSPASLGRCTVLLSRCQFGRHEGIRSRSRAAQDAIGAWPTGADRECPVARSVVVTASPEVSAPPARIGREPPHRRVSP